MLKPRTQAHLLLLATVLVWGATFSLVKSALQSISPLLFNLLRFLLATLTLAVLHRRHLRTLTPENLKLGVLTGLFLAAGYQLQTLGLVRTTPAKSAFITGLVVVFVPMLTLIPACRPAASARPGLSAAAGALFAFAGLLLLTTPAGTTFFNAFRSIGSGDLLTLLCALAFAAHLLLLGRASTTMHSGLLATLQISSATLLMLLTLPLEHVHLRLNPQLLLTLFLCGLLGTAAAFSVQSFAQSILPPTHTVVLLALEPVFAWLTSLLLLHDVLDPRSLAGAALILIGIFVVELLPSAHTTEIPA